MKKIRIESGKAIRKFREERGLTQTELAEKIGTTQSMIGKYERGEIDLSLSRLAEIANVLNITPDNIMGYK
jgi:transcriptional regulator with XRE-family HTH domain